MLTKSLEELHTSSKIWVEETGTQSDQKSWTRYRYVHIQTFSCEIEDFVESYVCKLRMICMILWSRVLRAVVVVVFTLNRSFYTTTSAAPPVSFLILHPRDIQIMWSQTVRQRTNKRWRFRVRKSSASVPGTRVKKKKNATREIRATKKILNE